ncbi:MAG: hypothetical protein L0Z50_12765 [Verrucomicrobiales bacterium]|nr:hypothetical protein [Verrucomicrobiales bacterium]
MTSLLILTVGTGTAGRHSDVAAGLGNTIRQVRPRKFWLVPSASEKSTPVADLIRETVVDLNSFAPWSESAAYHAIPNHDDIHECRRLVREVIAVAKQELRAEERLVVNPTSGTKQMSAGATLAALDEEVDQIDFTSGERVDGVVKTGTEVVQSFDLREFLFQRDLRTADELFHHGAFYAAARLLKGYPQPEALRARETALCLHEWQRMNYAKAASHAAKFSEELRAHLKNLADADEFSITVLGDLLGGADELLRWGDCEEALARYYRATEYAAKFRLEEAGEPSTDIGWKDAWSRLQQLGDPLAKEFWADGALRHQLQERNESVYGHGLLPVDALVIQAVRDRLRNLFAGELPGLLSYWSVDRRPTSLH